MSENHLNVFSDQMLVGSFYNAVTNYFVIKTTITIIKCYNVESKQCN